MGFDLIFLVRDVREEERDRMICKHVMGVHLNNSGNIGSSDGGDGLFGMLSAANAFDEDIGSKARCVASISYHYVVFPVAHILFSNLERKLRQTLLKRSLRMS